MQATNETIRQSARDVKVASRADVVVVGGGPAGLSAALAAARNGAKVTLLERYNHLGGLASGGMVLVLDDMWDNHLNEISVRGTCQAMIERLAALKLAVYPRSNEWGHDPASLRRWTRWGAFDFHTHSTPHPICFAAAFDPDGWKRVALDMVQEAGIELRLHSWFSHTLVEDGRVTGVVCESKSGPQAILGTVVIDATGDLDVAASAGAPHTGGNYIMTTVFRLGGVDTETAERYEREQPEEYAALDRRIKKVLGGSWGLWWLKTPLPGIVWCNCPHMAGLDGQKVEDLTRAEVQGRKHIHALVDLVRQELPGFGEGHKGVLTIDILNVANMLNKKWGNYGQVGFPYTVAPVGVEGIDAATGKYIYRGLSNVAGTGIGNVSLNANPPQQSLWRVQVGLRYEF
jgi:hypothetical protein